MLCKDVGLTMDDLKKMTLGMALDYIHEYYEMKNPDKKKNEKVVEYADEVPWL